MVIVVGTSDEAMILGRGGLTGIVDKQLSRTQAQLSRRITTVGEPMLCCCGNIHM